MFSAPVLPVHFTAVNTAHKCDLTAVFFNQLRNIVGTHDTLPDVDSHFDHGRHQIGSVGV